jgi:hypothetical protein
VRLVAEPSVPEIDLLAVGHLLLSDSDLLPRGAMRFGARLDEESKALLVSGPGHNWDAAAGPTFVVEDDRAAMLGTYVQGGRPGMAVREGDGWRSIYCGAPLLPAWLFRRIAMLAGVHLYTPGDAQVFHRGPLVAVYKPGGGPLTISARPGQRLQALVPDPISDHWQPDPGMQASPVLSAVFQEDETKFYLAVT